MTLGYLHIYGAEEGEVKGHVGVKRSGGIWSCAPHLGCPVVRLYVCDTLVKDFVWNMLISLFLHQFCFNLVQMILRYLHIYGADKGEVKGHVGAKGQVEYGHVHHFWVKVFCLKHANFFISASILFKLGTDNHWVLAHIWCRGGWDQRSCRGQKVRLSGCPVGCTYVTLWLLNFLFETC